MISFFILYHSLEVTRALRQRIDYILQGFASMWMGRFLSFSVSLSEQLPKGICSHVEYNDFEPEYSLFRRGFPNAHAELIAFVSGRVIGIPGGNDAAVRELHAGGVTAVAFVGGVGNS